MTSSFTVGIIGGTGLEDPQILSEAKKFDVSTPFGKPSSPLTKGKISGVNCVLISRHGLAHEYSPSRINYRANIWAMKQSGVDVIIASSASGSLCEEMAPGHIVFVDSFIDRTTKREQSFYDGIPENLNGGTSGSPVGICHIPMHPCFSNGLKNVLKSCAQELGIWYHTAGTTVCIEGPRFSTRAESNLYRSWGAHLVGMTVCPEVSIDLVAKTLEANAKNTKELFIKTVAALQKHEETIRDEIINAKNIAKSSVMTSGNSIKFDYIEIQKT